METSAPETKQWNCPPTLSDNEVLDFCKTGYLLLKAVVPARVNRLAVEYCARNGGSEPTGILAQSWFVEEVILNPLASGAVRSLLGRDFHLPILMSNHRVEAPFATGGWHVDGNSIFSHRLENLQVFYYPQDTPLAMGPTQVLPGSHLVRNKAHFMAHLNNIRGVASTAAPAGSIFLTAYPIWHRRGLATGRGVRNLLKYFYWRTTPPARDWIIETNFDFATTNYGSPIAPLVEQFRADLKVAEMFLWLCGKHSSYRNLGGQSWPLPARRNDPPYGLPQDL